MEKQEFLKKVSDSIKKNRLLRDQARVLVAVSGGADSVALLLVLKELGYQCVAAHCNFHLRGEDSDSDQKFVEALVCRLGIEYVSVEFDVAHYKSTSHVSTEMACRELRYEWFESQLKETGCEAVAVGHHRNDKRETFFLNLLRGTGLKGLATMKPRNGNVIRPMLEVSRDEIEQFLISENESFVNDYTNFQTEYKRNKVRNLLLPYINELFPENSLDTTIESVVGNNEFYQGAVSRAINQCVVISENSVKIYIEKLLNYQGAKTLLFEIMNGYGFNKEQVYLIYDMIGIDDKLSHCVENPRYRAIMNRNEIEIVTVESYDTEYSPVRIVYGETSTESLPFSMQLVEFTDDFVFERNATCAYFDNKILEKELILRKWKQGDRIRPFGMKGTKKVSDVFAEFKLTSVEKRAAWVLEADGQIVWLPGLKNSDLYRCKRGDKILFLSMK